MSERTRPADKRHPAASAHSPNADLFLALETEARAAADEAEAVMVRTAARLAPLRVAIDGLLSPCRDRAQTPEDKFWRDVQEIADAGRAVRQGDGSSIQVLLDALNEIPAPEGMDWPEVGGLVMDSWVDLASAAYYLGVAATLQCMGGRR